VLLVTRNELGFVNAVELGVQGVLGPAIANDDLGGAAAWGLILTAESIVLVYECPDATPLAEPTDGQLDDLWGCVCALHARHVTHRALTAGRIMADPQGRVVLPIPVTGG